MPTTPSRVQPSTAISPPSGEYLIALESRFASTCFNRLGSASATSASCGMRPAGAADRRGVALEHAAGLGDLDLVERRLVGVGGDRLVRGEVTGGVGHAGGD